MKNTLLEKGNLDWSKPKRDHRVFSQFRPFNGVVPTEFWVEFTGAHFRNAFEDRPPVHHGDTVHTASRPAFNEEYLEWVALLATVHCADSSFSMIELGSGMGHWLMNGALSARQKNKSVQLVGVEAEPTHFAFMKQAFKDNGLSTTDHRLIQAAVGGTEGERWFTFGNADHWYGQSLVDEGFVEHRRQIQATQEFKSEGDEIEYQFTKVPVIALRSILKDVSHVDLLDMDIQGAEADVVEQSSRDIHEKVDVAFIATHSIEVETRLRTVFDSIQWVNVFDFSCFSGLNDTPFGLVNLPDDGMQCWVNPRRSDVVSEIFEGREVEWTACRHRNFCRNFRGVFDKLKLTETRLTAAKSQADNYEHLYVNCMREKAHLEEQLTTLQKKFEGVGPRSAQLIRNAKKVKSFLTNFGRKKQSS